MSLRTAHERAERPSSHASSHAPSGLLAVRLRAFADTNAQVVVGDETLEARVDPAVDPRVLETAIARGERVIVQREAGELVVLGTLRTAATLGVDEGDFVIRAGRLRVVVGHAFEVVGGAASLVLRASGHVETLAEEITARATSVQRLVARMLRLN